MCPLHNKPVCCIINDTSYEPHHGSMTVMKNLKEQLRIYFLIKQSFPIHYKPENISNLKEKLSDVDVIIVNGEGTIHDSQKTAEQLLDFVKLCYSFNKNIYLINSTLFNNNKETMIKLKYFTNIFVRDKASLSVLKKHKINGYYVPDLVFLKSKSLKPLFQKDSKIIVNDSILSEVTNELFNIYQKNKIKFKYIPMLSLFRPNENKYKLKITRIVRYIRHIFIIFFYQLFNYNKNYFLSYKNYSYYPFNFITELNKSSGVITGRYHTVCMALKLNIPFLYVSSNTRKIEDLLSDVGFKRNRSINLKHYKDLEFLRIPSYNEEEHKLLFNFLKQSDNKIKEMFTKIYNKTLLTINL